MISRLAEHFSELILLAIAALIFGIIRVWMMPGAKSAKVYVISILISVPTGTLIGAMSLEWGFGDYASMTCASVGSLLAHDILTGIMNNKGFLGILIKRAAENLTDKLTK